VTHRHALTDAQWAMISIVVPKRRGPEPKMDDRTFIDAVLYRAKTGIPWRDLPERFGSWKTVFNRFSNWSRRGHWAAILKALQHAITLLNPRVVRGPVGMGYLTGRIDTRTNFDQKTDLRSGFSRFSPEKSPPTGPSSSYSSDSPRPRTLRLRKSHSRGFWPTTGNSRFEQAEIDAFGKRVEARGGRLIGHIFLRRGRIFWQKSREELLQEVRAEIEEFR
jgi:transposase